MPTSPPHQQVKVTHVLMVLMQEILKLMELMGVSRVCLALLSFTLSALVSAFRQKRWERELVLFKKVDMKI